MKTFLLVAVTLTALALQSATAQSNPEPPQISVSGSADVRVPPDEIYVNAGVETRHESLAVAKRENDERISGALEFLKRSGVEDKNIQTDFVGIEPSYDNNNVSRTKPVVYIVQKNIGIKLKKIGNFESVLTGLLTNGVNYVRGIDFRTSELRKHRDAARAMAVHAAREKADALAGELGVKRGKVYRITEYSGGGSWNWSGGWRYGYGAYQNVSQVASQAAGGTPEETEGTFSIGQISVSATVNVSFLIE